MKQSANMTQSRRSTPTDWHVAEEGLDKSTLVPLLDRLERDGLIVRTVSERDRRARIPQATPAGVAMVKTVAIARDAAINDRLAAIPPSQRASFHATLWSIVESAAKQG